MGPADALYALDLIRPTLAVPMHIIASEQSAKTRAPSPQVPSRASTRCGSWSPARRWTFSPTRRLGCLRPAPGKEPAPETGR
jgi:hypothetical protein